MGKAKYTYVPEWKRRNEELCYIASKAIESGMSYGNYIAKRDGRLPKVVLKGEKKK